MMSFWDCARSFNPFTQGFMAGMVLIVSAGVVLGLIGKLWLVLGLKEIAFPFIAIIFVLFGLYKGRILKEVSLFVSGLAASFLVVILFLQIVASTGFFVGLIF